MILAVDLAARFSAAILRGAGGEVLHQFDSRDKTAQDFCHEVAQIATQATLTVIEDVPYGISSQFMVKPVLRLQGAIVAHLTTLQVEHRAVFLVPSTWMKDYPGVMHATTKGLTKAAADQERIETAAYHAERSGYTPPDLVSDYVQACSVAGKKVLKKNTNSLAKSQTDYVSAWLMSEYARQFTLEELLTKPGVQRASL